MISFNPSNPWMKLFVQSDNEQYQVVAIVNDINEANRLCALNPHIGVICEDMSSGCWLLAEMSATDKLRGNPPINNIVKEDWKDHNGLCCCDECTGGKGLD